MVKDTDKNLVCRQCGRHFVFSRAEQEFYEQKGFNLPSRCRECRSTRQNEAHHLACSKCGAELEKENEAYCEACLASARLEIEIKARKGQEAVSAARTKLLAAESEKAKLAESLRRKEQEMEEMELKLADLSQELEKAVQFHAGLEWLQPKLNAIAERIKNLEHSQSTINERMLQTIRVMAEKYEDVKLWEAFKRSLRQHLKESA